MGANEKHAATYHAWTPVTSFVMGAYEYDRSQIGGVSAAVSRAEFTRWLETVRAEAKSEALREAAYALDSAMVNIEVLYGDPDLKQAWEFRNGERKSIIQSLRARANHYKENQS